MTSAATLDGAARTRALVDAIEQTDLLAPSLLPGWSRLTIACHLRYGAEALLQMTHDALAGRPTAYYPEGRSTQRPGTLVPRPGESPSGVVRSLASAGAALDAAWADIDDWDIVVTEPDGNADLGSRPLCEHALMRLTEIEVHGTDLDIGLGPWSDVLIGSALAVRLSRLAERAPLTSGSWRLIATDGDVDLLVGDPSTPQVIEASKRDLFALTLGRLVLSESFSRAFPGP